MEDWGISDLELPPTPTTGRGMFDLEAQRQASTSFREERMRYNVMYMTRDSLRIVPPVFLDNREAPPDENTDPGATR